MTVVTFDTETGGLDPHHPTIQLAAVATSDDFAEELEAFEVKIAFEETQAEPEALRMNGYSPEIWMSEAKSEGFALQAFASFCRRHSTLTLVSQRTGRPYNVAQLAGYNVARFDAPRLVDAFKRFNLFLPATAFQPLDVYQRALWWFRETGKPLPENLKLATLGAYFGVPVEGAHDALADCRISIGIARAMRGASA